MIKEKSCFDCRYYDYKNCTCNKLWNIKAILNEEESAKNCKDFVRGEYDEEIIEKEFWLK